VRLLALAQPEPAAGDRVAAAVGSDEGEGGVGAAAAEEEVAAAGAEQERDGGPAWAHRLRIGRGRARVEWPTGAGRFEDRAQPFGRLTEVTAVDEDAWPVGLWDRDYMRRAPARRAEPFVRQEDPAWEPGDRVAELGRARRRYRWRRRVRFWRDVVLSFLLVLAAAIGIAVVLSRSV
jgi:hypothetical protein